MSIKYHDGEQWRDSYPSPPLRRPVDGGSSGSAVNANWAQNDPTQPDYVKNRTHWVEGELSTIEWDGVTEGKPEFYGFFKASEAVLPLSEVIGGKIVIPGVGEFEISEESVYDDIDNFGLYMIDIGSQPGIMVVLSIVDGAAEDIPPETGLYFASDLPSGSYLAYGNQTIHQIDKKFIPDDTLIVPLNVSFTQNGSDYEGYAYTDMIEEDIIAAHRAGKSVVLKCVSNSFVNTYLPLKYTDEYNTILNFSASVPNEDGTVRHWFIAWLQHYGWTATVRVRNVLPAVTTDNNGAFLRVVNGAYALVNLTDVSTTVADVTAAPTAADFNALLAALRAAGVLAE